MACILFIWEAQVTLGLPEVSYKHWFCEGHLASCQKKWPWLGSTECGVPKYSCYMTDFTTSFTDDYVSTPVQIGQSLSVSSALGPLMGPGYYL